MEKDWGGGGKFQNKIKVQFTLRGVSANTSLYMPPNWMLKSRIP